MRKMNRFLQECQKVYHNIVVDPSYYQKVRVVLGNESCDLDSAISALVYGYIIHHENKQKGVRNYEVLPLLNLSHDDFPLKTEVIYYLKLHGVSLEAVPTRGGRDLLNLSKLHRAGILELTLVDHHSLPLADHDLISSVVEVIDHRPQDPEWEWPNAEVTIEPVGSCCTLIAKKILERSPHLLTFHICHLLYGPILLDTFNFAPEAKRTSETDKQVIASLEKKISVDRNKLFQDLVHAKTHVSELSDSQILRKDLKIVSGIPVPGLPMLVYDFVKRYGIEQSLLNFIKSRHDVPVMVIMGVRISGDSIERDIGVFSTTLSVGDRFVEALKNFDAPSLQLMDVSDHDVGNLRLLKQCNVQMSRKQIAPIIQKVAATLTELSFSGNIAKYPDF